MVLLQTWSADVDTPEKREESTVLLAVSRLLQLQTEALAAQTVATTAQHLPPLKLFSGEAKQTEEDGFKRWLEHFEGRAKLAGWNPPQQLHHLKLLLKKTALKAFHTFPEVDCEEFILMPRTQCVIGSRR